MHCKNVDSFVRNQAINNAIVTQNEFPNPWVIKFGHFSTRVWVFSQLPGSLANSFNLNSGIFFRILTNILSYRN